MELLVVIGIMAVLLAASVGVYKGTIEKGEMAQELAAGKTLGSAYLNYAADNDGQLMVGFQKAASPVSLPDGSTVSGEAAARYIWRLAPYFDFNMNGLFYGKDRGRAGQISEESSSGYGESLSLFGMNAFYVGGYYENATTPMLPLGEIATRLGQVERPSSLLVFATARNSQGKGNFLVKAPRTQALPPGFPVPAQPDWPPNGSSDSTGHVDFRYDEKAICVFLDGSVRLHHLAELNDMRMWSKNAAQQDNPNYAPTMENGGGGGRR